MTKASINSLASQIPIELLFALVEGGIWTLERALLYARQLPKIDDKARALAGLSRYISCEQERLNLLKESLRLAESIEYSFYRAITLTDVAQYLTGEMKNKAVRAAREVAERVRFDCYKLAILANVSVCLEGPQREDMLDSVMDKVREMPQGIFEGSMLLRIIPCLARAGRMDEALDMVYRTDSLFQENALVAMCPYLTEIYGKNKAIEIAKRMKFNRNRARCLGEIARTLPKSESEELIEYAISIVQRSVEDEKERLQFLGRVVTLIGGTEQETIMKEVLREIRQMKRICDRLDVLKYMADYAGEEILREVDQAIEDASCENIVKEALERMIPLFVSGKRLEEIVLLVNRVRDPLDKMRLIKSISVHLIENKHIRKAIDMLGEIERIAQESGNDRLKYKFWAEILLSMPERFCKEMIEEIMQIIQVVKPESDQVRLMLKVVDYLPFKERKKMLDRALKLAKDIQTDLFRAKALAEVALLLEEPDRGEILEEALQTAESMEEFLLFPRADAFAHIALCMAKAGRLKEALELAIKIENRRFRRRAEEYIVPYLISWVDADREKAFKSWSEILHVLARRSRADLLSDLGALAPLIGALGGEKALLGVVDAVDRVTTWWP